MNKISKVRYVIIWKTDYVSNKIIMFIFTRYLYHIYSSKYREGHLMIWPDKISIPIIKVFKFYQIKYAILKIKVVVVLF